MQESLLTKVCKISRRSDIQKNRTYRIILFHNIKNK